MKVPGTQRGLWEHGHSAQPGLFWPLSVTYTLLWHIQSLPHAHLHAKLPALAGEPGLPSTLPLLSKVGEKAGARGQSAWGAGVGKGPIRLHLGWGCGKQALNTKDSHPL